MVKTFEITDKILYIIYESFTVAMSVYSGDVFYVYWVPIYRIEVHIIKIII